MQHLIDFNEITLKEWQDLYALTSDILKSPGAYADTCQGKVLGSLFYEPSTRTNFSFKAAMLKLGGSVIGFSNPDFSSVAKGETLKDTIGMMSNYCDIIVIRNPYEGAARAASLYSKVPLINAGDGGHLHPTQTLTDLTTIMRLRGSIDGINIGLCGDLKYGRTVHSLIKALSRFNDVKFHLISPDELRIPDYIKSFMISKGQHYTESDELEPVIPSLDILYMTRIQRERFDDESEYERLKGFYILDLNKLNSAKKQLLIMHPLPRLDEIKTEVDEDKRAVYFEQARLGMYARMALIYTMLRGVNLPYKNKLAESYANELSIDCKNPRCITSVEKYLPHYVYEKENIKHCAYCDHII